MKQISMGRYLLTAALGIICLLAACKKSNSSPANGDSGTGSFSVVLDGKAISGTDVHNAGIVILKADPGASFTPDGDIFLAMQASGDSIGLHLPDRTGVTVIGNSSPAHIYGVFTIPNTVYLFNSVSVNVTTLTDTRIKGTFSGQLSTSLSLNEGTVADISNGTFDLPMIQ